MAGPGRPRTVNLSRYSCPNLQCPDHHKTNANNLVSDGTYQTRTGAQQKMHCLTCGTRFSSHPPGPLGNRYLHETTIALALVLLANGIPINRVAYVTCTTENTLTTWLKRIARDPDRFTPLLLTHPHLDPAKLDALLAAVREGRLRQQAARWIWRTRKDPEFAERMAIFHIPEHPLPADVRKKYGIMAFQFPRRRPKPSPAPPRSRLRRAAPSQTNDS